MSTESNPQKKRKMNAYLKYSGMAFQMLSPILLGVYIGYRLDAYFATTPLFLVVLLLGGLALAMYIVMREFM